MLRADLSLQQGDFALSVQLELPTPGITVLFGPSGCGKSTLLRCLVGLEPQTRGTITLNGTPWLDTARRLALPAHRRAVALMFQDARLFPHLDVAGNLRYAARRSGADNAEWDQAVALVDAQPLLQRRVQSLSGGERQRVAIARTLLAKPALLLLDEPLAALDADRKREILPYLERLAAQRLPIIYVTHSIDELLTLADHLVLMQDGGVTAAGPLNTLLARLDLPLARRDDAATVVHGTIAAIDQHYHLATLDLGTQQLRIPVSGAEIGRNVRLRVQARDVSLCLHKPEFTSVLNVLPATVTGIGAVGSNGQQLIQLDLDGQLLLARISAYSCAHLQLHEGMALYAQMKSAALVT